MDFKDKKFQVSWNESRIKDERERAAQIGSRIKFISIIYTVFAVFAISLYQFLIDDKHTFNLIFTFSFVVFIVLFIISITNAIQLLTPTDVAFAEEPKVFYQDLRAEYIANGITESEVNDYLLESYLIQVQDTLSHNIATNNKKSKFNYRSIRYALFALIPYSICVGIMLTNEIDKIQKIEIVNPHTNKIMAKEKPKVNPAKVIVRPPVMIKENAEISKGESAQKIKDEKK